MRTTTEIVVRKRDGSCEAFDVEKLRHCLGRVLKAAGLDSRYAGALAQAVALHLRSGQAPQSPSAAYIRRCCRLVLFETGQAEAARCMDQFAGGRERRRRLVRIGAAQTSAARWRKRRVVETFERRHGLTRPVARILASEVEGRVFQLGYGLVSAALVREIIGAELSAWGLAADSLSVCDAR